MAILQKPKTLTNEEKQALRRAEIDHNKVMQQQENDRRAEARAEHDAFVQRAQKSREEFAQAQAQGDVWVPDEPILHVRDVWAATRASELKAEADAEAARIANLSPRELWFSTLNFQDQRKVEVWERVNRGQKYPVPGLE